MEIKSGQKIKITKNKDSALRINEMQLFGVLCFCTVSMVIGHSLTVKSIKSIFNSSVLVMSEQIKKKNDSTNLDQVIH